MKKGFFLPPFRLAPFINGRKHVSCLADGMEKMMAGGVFKPGWVGDVLAFWFGELEEEDWFRKSDTVDELIRVRFAELHQKLQAGPAIPEDAHPRTTLAAIIVMDQFSRNIFRGTPKAFAADGQALGLAKRMVDGGTDAGMMKNERLFLYLPFEHSEDLGDQERSVELMSKLGDDKLTRYAIAHADIIKRFGRFPHRNAVLGRRSTPQEAAFLKEPGSSF
jgi:uncharacterized protein (DUF924 family)